MVGAGKRLSLADCREDVEAAAGVSPTVAASAAGILPQDMADRLAMFAAATTSEVGGTVSEVDDRQLIEMEPLDEEDEEEEEHVSQVAGKYQEKDCENAFFSCCATA